MSNVGCIIDERVVSTLFPLLVLFCHGGQISIGVHFSGKDKIASSWIVAEIAGGFAWYRTDESRERVFVSFGGKYLICVDVGA